MFVVSDMDHEHQVLYAQVKGYTLLYPTHVYYTYTHMPILVLYYYPYMDIQLYSFSIKIHFFI